MFFRRKRVPNPSFGSGDFMRSDQERFALDDQELVEALITELSDWSVNPDWPQERVLNFERDLSQLADRLGTTPGGARTWLINEAEVYGLHI